MQQEANLWQLFSQERLQVKIEIVSRGFETLLNGNSVVELERGCGMCRAISGLGAVVREALKFSPGARPGPPELGRALACMLIVILDPYILPCERFNKAGGSTLPMLLQPSAQGRGKHACFRILYILSGAEDE